MNGQVVAIYTTSRGGEPLVMLSTATLEAGRGIAGDRYYQHRGTFSEKLKDGTDWEVTLIEQEEIDIFNRSRGTILAAGDFRRNVVTTGIRLNELVGRQFSVGGALLEGIRLCEPCSHLAKFVGADVVKSMAHRAGLRARILVGATVKSGDAIEPGRKAGVPGS